jgi:DNA-binding HxlR family transcriptional regulator
MPGARSRPAVASTDPAGDPLGAALLEVGDRWTLLVVDALLEGPRRFNEIQSDVDGIATNVLAKRLLQLEHRALVVASAYSTHPPRFTYELTSAGHDLAGALRLLRQWGARRQGAATGSTGSEHAACGTPLEPRWWCSTCDRAVDDVEAGAIRFL